MKRVGKLLFLFFSLVLVLTACSSTKNIAVSDLQVDGAFAFPGIAFGTSVEELTAKFGDKFLLDVMDSDSSGNDGYVVKDTYIFNNRKTDVEFLFRDNGLYLVRILYPVNMEDKNEIANALFDVKEMLIKEFGQPEELVSTFDYWLGKSGQLRIQSHEFLDGQKIIGIVVTSDMR